MRAVSEQQSRGAELAFRGIVHDTRTARAVCQLAYLHLIPVGVQIDSYKRRPFAERKLIAQNSRYMKQQVTIGGLLLDCICLVVDVMNRLRVPPVVKEGS